MKKILVVEDDAYSAAAISVRLRHFGFETAIARNAFQAFMMAVHDRPDLLLLDVGLPDKDGFNLAGDLKRFPVTAEIPIIFVTGSKDPRLREKVLNLKAAGLLEKPYEPEVLLLMAQMAFDQPRRSSRSDRPGTV
jgi:DNA-binding response OmpR family regulator